MPSAVIMSPTCGDIAGRCLWSLFVFHARARDYQRRPSPAGCRCTGLSVVGLRSERDGGRLHAAEVHRARRAEVVDDGVLVLLARNQRLPAGEMFRAVEVAAGDARQSGLGDPAEELLSVEQLDAIEEPTQVSPAPSEVAGGERDRPRRSRVVGMGDHDRGTPVARRLESGSRPVVHRDKASQPDRDGVTGAVGVRIVVRELEAGHEHQAVGRERPVALALYVCEVGIDVRGVDARATVSERPRIIAAQDVVGNTENIEAGRSVEVDHRAERKLAVAPSRVGVELAEQVARASAHSPPVCPRTAAQWVNAW
jgi:hypothetical protein